MREQWRLYAPLRPTSRALRRVLGLRHDGTEIPGAVLVATNSADPGVGEAGALHADEKLVKGQLKTR